MTDLLLLSQGGVQIYYGPLGPSSDAVLGYFANLGKHWPRFKNPADFVLDQSNDKRFEEAWQVRYLMVNGDIVAIDES
jgi:hypothetical protein